MTRRKKPQIYISGPITGYNLDERRAAFKKVQEQLENEAGWATAFNPLENGLPANAHRQEHMKADLTELLKSDCIYMMTGWEQSAGCQLEFNIATQIGLGVFMEVSKQFINDFSIAKFI